VAVPVAVPVAVTVAVAVPVAVTVAVAVAVTVAVAVPVAVTVAVAVDVAATAKSGIALVGPAPPYGSIAPGAPHSPRARPPRHRLRSSATATDTDTDTDTDTVSDAALCTGLLTRIRLDGGIESASTGSTIPCPARPPVTR
jgi:hypothetical protein